MDHSLLNLPSSDKIIYAITQCRNLEEKYGLLDKLLSQLVYTNVNQAVKYVEKLRKINSFGIEHNSPRIGPTHLTEHRP